MEEAERHLAEAFKRKDAPADFNWKLQFSPYMRSVRDTGRTDWAAIALFLRTASLHIARARHAELDTPAAVAEAKGPEAGLAAPGADCPGRCCGTINRIGLFAATSCNVSGKPMRPQRLMTARSAWRKMRP